MPPFHGYDSSAISFVLQGTSASRDIPERWLSEGDYHSALSTPRLPRFADTRATAQSAQVIRRVSRRRRMLE